MDDDRLKNIVSHAQSDMANLPPERMKPVEPIQAPGPKIGEGHAMAMLRLGGHELTNALAAFPDSNIRPQEELGVFGNTTPQIVTEQITGQEVDTYSDRLNQAAQRDSGNDREGRSR